MAQMPNDVLDHDHRAIHDHSEIQRAQGEKVCGNLCQIQPNGGEQQSKRNREGDDECGANVAKKKQKDDRYQNHPFAQVVQHGMSGVTKKIAAIQHGNDLHTLRQDALVELLHFLVNPVESWARVRALPQQHNALDDVVLIDDRAIGAMGGPGHATQANSWALVRPRRYP